MVLSALMILAAAALVAWKLNTPAKEPPAPPLPPPLTKAFYTVDDGQTWFVDEIHKASPFDKDGKEACRVMVYQCGGKQFAGYLQRYTAEGRAKFAELANKPYLEVVKEITELSTTATEVKKPGDKTWVPAGDDKASEIMDVACPSGTTGSVQAVYP
jgi:hypothetical protein